MVALLFFSRMLPPRLRRSWVDGFKTFARFPSLPADTFTRSGS